MLHPVRSAIGFAFAIAACVTASAPRHTITGTLTLIDSSVGNTIFGPFALDSTSCAGGGGYSDVGPGKDVVLKDGEGKTLAVGRLGSGIRKDDLGTSPRTYRCLFSFALEDVPEVPFYAVDLGRRGTVTYSLTDMRTAEWTLSLTLGK
jgi:hypothetical protein